MKRLLISSIVVGALSTCSMSPTLPDSYSAGPTWGTVADAATNEPLRNVLVIAMWNLGISNRPLKIMESVTDEKGEFRMPAWGPIARPNVGRFGLDDQDPLLIFYKPGYVKLGRSSTQGYPPGENPRIQLSDRTFAFNGDTTLLKKYNGPAWSYLIFLHTNLSDVLEGADRCRWKEIPRSIRMLQDETNRMVADKPNMAGYFSAKRLMDRPECVPSDDFLKKYQQPY